MQTAKNIVCLVLTFTVLFSGLPFFMSEDANRDNAIDLQDTILNVRKLARSVETPGSFSVSMEKAVSTLHRLAGLKTVIRKDSRSNIFPTPPAPDFFGLISVCDLSAPVPTVCRAPEKNSSYQSVTLTPLAPPPRALAVS